MADGEHGDYATRSLEGLRAKLLDLSGRNKLLNFSHREPSRTQVRVVDEIPELLFADLLAGKAYQFRSLPEAAKEHASWTSMQLAVHHGISPSYDLPSLDGEQILEKHKDGFLQTLLARDKMDRSLEAIRSGASGYLQELGVHTLHACFGFLRWYESDSSEKALDAPLVLLPMTMERKLSRSGYVYTLQATGDEPESNVTLRHRLRNDFGIELPEIEGGAEISDYLDEVQAVVSSRHRWMTRRWLTVAIVRFERVVMFQDLAPEAWDDAGPTDHEVLEQLLVGRDSPDGDHYDDIPDLDHPSVANRLPLLVTDADASQTAAIMDALSGRNLVIQGPPGTGKSQTITNLIAAAMAQCKTVLFVAQKAAAVDVVAERLKQAGLGDFVLSLHSTSASKAAVHASLAERLALKAGPSNTETLRARGDELRQQRNKLNDYLRALNTPFGALGTSLHDILWTYDRLRERAKAAACAMREVRLPDVLALTGAAMRDQMDDLRAVEAAYVAARKDFIRGRHPWGDVVDVTEADCSEASQDALVAASEAWTRALSTLIADLRALGIDEAHCNAMQAGALAAALRKLPSLDARSAALLGRLQADRNAGALASFVSRATAKSAAHETIAASCSKPAELLGAETLISDAAHRIEQIGWSSTTLATMPSACRATKQSASKLADAAEVLTRVCSALQWDGADAAACVRALVPLAEILSTTPRELILSRSAAALAEKPPGALDSVVSRAKELNVRTRALDGRLRSWRTQSPIELRGHADVLRKSGWFERWFGTRYKAAEVCFSTLTGRSAPAADMAADLEQLAAHLERCLAFSAEPSVQWLSRNGVDWTTEDLDGMQRVDAWATRIRARLAGLDPWVRAQRAVLMNASADLLDGVRAELEAPGVMPALHAWAERADHGDPATSARAISKRADELEECLAKIGRIGIHPHLPGRALSEILAHLGTLRRLDAELTSDASARAVLGDLAETVMADPGLAERVLAARSAISRLALPDRLVRQIYETNTADALMALRDAGTRIESSLSIEQQARSQAATLGIMADLFVREGVPESIGGTLERLRAALANPQALSPWFGYCAASAEAYSEPGAAALLRACEVDGAEPIGLADYFEWLVYRDLVDRAAKAYPLINSIEWTGDRLDATRRRFAELDREVLQHQRVSLRNQLAAAQMPAGNGRGPKSEWTDGALILNEANKQKRHIPIRALVARAGDALTAIKPCFMMSPLSVAQFLAPGTVEFDLLVIDEASQMRPEDACGAVLRARQVVIVGDNKQLPPTSFFGGAREDGDEDSDDDPPMESILDWATSTFRPIRDLRWHYRSRHESLIAFSNTMFYGDRLTVFPSPEAPTAGLGVHLRYVKGLYKSSVNRPEAEAIVAEAIRLMDEAPDKSLGIVAMNVAQMEVIRELLDDAIQSRGDDTYRELWSDSMTPFFVRNLEAVQGDERDTILVSLTYGPEAAGGRVMQRFGPINGQYGHRRLNVLFTRARERVIVISSMKPTDVLADPGKSPGVHALRAYLEYAASGGRALSARQRSEQSADSPFEVSVADFLRQHGFDVAHQIGVRGFSIDLAIRHPKTGGFLCGVECDGATYHSSRSARDRDRLRQEILEGLGWNIVRVWSTDWFRGRENAQRTLLSRIAAASGSPQDAD